MNKDPLSDEVRVVAEYRAADRRKTEMENAASQEMSRKQSAGCSVRAVFSVRPSLNPAFLSDRRPSTA
ncbi:hypothetical protein SMATCC274_35870 [Serratia marcescens]|nr:hypothetical protein SMATCC274_35870 [Serratia marcescens]